MDKGHGRIETRTIFVIQGAPKGCSFPFVEQICRIDRQRHDFKGNLISSETAYAVTSQSQKQASPEDLLSQNRGHWSIENGLHYVRDVTFGEDQSRIRKNKGPHVMAILRNIVIGLMRLAGIKNIAQGLRHFAYAGKRSAMRMIGIL